MSSPVDERISDELEALKAILMDDFVVKKTEDGPDSIEYVVHPSTGDDVDQQFVCVTLEVRLVSGYPDVSPEVLLRNPRGLDDKVLKSIHTQIDKKLQDNLGQPVVYEVIELIRENLTRSNLPSGQCVICLFDFVEGDVFIKTQCYHYFHSYCLACHLKAGKNWYQDAVDRLPSWQQADTPKHQTCPVCRCRLDLDFETLKSAPPPVDSINAPPFRLTAELKALQKKMAEILARQKAKGGVVGMGDNGPPPLTITSPSDNDGGSTSQDADKADALARAAAAEAAPGSPKAAPVYRGPYRGFNRRGKPGGRRGRGAPAGSR
ncbi:E3 ubiquitin-protein ligase RNF25 isoform X2 [Ostrinia furnacalis]|uniref:E3 ubiquitin-protein ligase RNF25 isoform X2 n=1 Tax=Ostrinia furnacalis TaxID=93504 RepID=UPI001038D63D|nr:E3 ubiquitin-protein ligase RNF25 isoform X2 [Ostrinia furnacalis]